MIPPWGKDQNGGIHHHQLGCLVLRWDKQQIAPRPRLCWLSFRLSTYPGSLRPTSAVTSTAVPTSLPDLSLGSSQMKVFLVFHGNFPWPFFSCFICIKWQQRKRDKESHLSIPAHSLMGSPSVGSQTPVRMTSPSGYLLYDLYHVTSHPY